MLEKALTYNKTAFSLLTGFSDVFVLSSVLLVAGKPTAQPKLA